MKVFDSGTPRCDIINEMVEFTYNMEREMVERWKMREYDICGEKEGVASYLLEELLLVMLMSMVDEKVSINYGKAFEHKYEMW